MIKNLLTLAALLLVLSYVDAQSFWKRADEAKISLRSNDSRPIIPEKYDVYSLDLVAIKAHLSNAPMEFTGAAKSKNHFIELPLPDGEMEKFYVVESPVMEAGLSSKYPSIKSYKAFSIKNKRNFARISVGPNGLYAAISTANGEKYIDPYSHFNITDYIVYNVSDHHPDYMVGKEICGTTGESRQQITGFIPASRNAGQVELRTYKVAMACTGEWGQRPRRGTVEKCLADMSTMLNRMNMIYEREMAMRYQLIDDNDKLIFLDPDTDPYQNSDQGKVILGTNTQVINARIPASSYDIGHVLSVCFDIGGVAQLGSACQSNKGNGVTCNNNDDLSNIVTRVMAHEVGHQLNASHTWNMCSSAADQRSGVTAYEPGSGTTIMSYAGTCGSDNVATSEDDYFHIGSIVQMTAKTTSGGNAYSCADVTTLDNRFPEVTVPTKTYVVPISTPLELIGSGTDEDGDALTFTWEQYDTGVEQPLGTAGSTGPLFRSLKPTSTGNIRFLPKASDITSGKFTDRTEVLPVNTREIKFRLSARDNNAEGGGLSWKEFKFNTTEFAGPFEITYPKLDVRFKVGDKLTVTWNVANTNAAPVNCQLVNIYASFNGELITGSPNLVPLALNVPNDGVQEVFIPNRISNFVRIVIKAADNIFLTSGVLASRIEAPTVPTVFFDAPFILNACQPENPSLQLDAVGFAGLVEPITFEVVSGLPQGAVATFTKNTVLPGESTSLQINTENIVGNQSSIIVVRAYVIGIDTFERAIEFNVVGGDISNIEKISPANAASSVGSLPRFNWIGKDDADSYEIQVSTNPSFDAQSIVLNTNTTDTTVLSSVILEKATIYYWRVRGINKCREGEWNTINAFITEALACVTYNSGVQNINISGAGPSEVTLPITIASDGVVSDVNIKLIKADHFRPSDLIVSLIAPSGKTQVLWSKKCSIANVNVKLDDQSPNFFQCPIHTGNTYRPENPLSTFNGESTKGDWTLKVRDDLAGSGGKLTEFNMEICGSVSVEQPYIVNNDTLKLFPGSTSVIGQILLLSQDNNNTAEQLTYTLVTLPSTGILLLNGNALNVGANFTQKDIENGNLSFRQLTVSEIDDTFSFVVSDGEGGWIPITTFVINISNNNPSSTIDVSIANDIYITPNPTSSLIHVSLFSKAEKFTNYFIRDLSNREFMRGKLTDTNTIDVTQLTTGAYFIYLSDGKQVIAKKLIKI